MSANNASARAFYIVVHFFAVPCKTTTPNYKIIGFVEKLNTRRYIFLSVFELTKPSVQIQLLDSPVKIDKLNNLEQLQSSLKQREFFFKLGFPSGCHRHSLILRVLTERAPVFPGFPRSCARRFSAAWRPHNLNDWNRLSVAKS